jgi:hypothetical protein
MFETGPQCSVLPSIPSDGSGVMMLDNIISSNFDVPLGLFSRDHLHNQFVAFEIAVVFPSSEITVM